MIKRYQPNIREVVSLQESNNQMRDDLISARKSRDEAVTMLQAAKSERANFEIQLRQTEKSLATKNDSVCFYLFLY